MIIVRRLTGQPFAINPDLIERIEATPDTILVLLDGTRYIVNESLDEVVSLVQDHRAAIVARSLTFGVEGSLASAVTQGSGAAVASVQAVPDQEDDDNVIVPLTKRPRGDK